MNSFFLIRMPAGAEWIAIAVVGLFIGLIPLIALIDIIRNEFRGSNDKVVWTIIVLFIPFFGISFVFLDWKKSTSYKTS